MELITSRMVLKNKFQMEWTFTSSISAILPLFQHSDFVFHFAAKNCISDCQLDPVETADINVHGTVNVFEASRKAKVKKVIYAESSALYEGSEVLPTPETEIRPQSFYAISKLSSMYFAQAYTRFFGTPSLQPVTAKSIPDETGYSNIP